ncbi:MAG: InlB B-repeat-containing protein, partial [Clostridiales bacterium]|nr:InlB B-repeat-containing protein [Clostridiales bacterium]
MEKKCFKIKKQKMMQLFCVFMALALLLSLIPISALADDIAADGDDPSIEAAASAEQDAENCDGQYLTEEGGEWFLEQEPELLGLTASSAADNEVSTEAELRTAVGSASSGVPITISLTNSITLTGNSLYISPNTDITLVSGNTGPIELTGEDDHDVITVPGSAKLTIDGIIVTHGGGSADNGGGVNVSYGGTLTLASGEISGNNNAFFGGGVYTEGNVIVNGGKIAMNRSGSFGGGVYINNNGTLRMTGGEISGNESTGSGPSGGGSGGGVYVNGGSFTMENGVIKDNVTPGGGGGVYNTARGTFNLSGGEIKGNTGSSGGVRNDGAFTMSGGSISGNHGVLFGGGVYNSGNTDFTLKAGNISGNDAPQGGGVYNVGSTSFKMEGGFVKNNNVTQVGGGVYNGGTSTFILSGGEISGNTAFDNGAGVINNGVFEMKAGASNARPVISGNIVTGDTAFSRGGGVYNIGNATFTMSDGEIAGNKALQGGGVHNYRTGIDFPAVFTMTGGEISSNEATSGGGVYTNSTFTMSAGRIANNKGSYGGGVYNLRPGEALDAVFTMNGGEVCGNTAIDGGGVYTNGSVIVNNGKFYDNIASNDGGGIWVDYNYLNRVSVSAAAEFSTNSAVKSYARNPADDLLYETQIKCTRWTVPLTQGYNNYDISYKYGAGLHDVTVTFNGNGGTVAPENAARTLTAGASLGANMPGDPNWGGHVFLGWNTMPDGTGTAFSSATTVDNDIEVFAQWRSETTEPDNFTITYVLNGGTGASGNPTSYNAESSFPISIA